MLELAFTRQSSTHMTPDRIRQARLSARLSQAEAAALVGATRRTWQNWEAPVDSPEHRNMPRDIWQQFEAMSAKAVIAWNRCVTPKAIVESIPAEWQDNFRKD